MSEPPTSAEEAPPAAFEPLEARAILPAVGDIVAKGKMALVPPGGEAPSKRSYTEVRLDAERMRPTHDPSGADQTSVAGPWTIRGYVLRYQSRGLRGGFRKLLPDTFATVPEALDALAHCWEIPDEALEHPRSYRIRKGLTPPPTETPDPGSTEAKDEPEPDSGASE